MANVKKMASTAKKSAKIIAMTAVATAASADLDRMAYEQAMADMEQEYGRGNVCRIVYMNPLGGLIA